MGEISDKIKMLYAKDSTAAYTNLLELEEIPKVRIRFTLILMNLSLC